MTDLAPTPKPAPDFLPEGWDRRTPTFLLQGETDRFTAHGISRGLPPGPAETLAQRVRSFFAAAHGEPGVLVGALPFDGAQPDFLYQPGSLSTGWNDDVVVRAPPRSRGWQVQAEPSPARYRQMVRQALELMHTGGGLSLALRKVVLSRSLLLTGEEPIDPLWLARRLAGDRSVTTFAVPLPPTPRGARTLVGATPELLVARTGRLVVSHPLAGSIRRGGDAVADRAAAAALENSEKDRREHAMVVEGIVETLAPFCTRLHAPAKPELRATSTMWHLGTRIEGELKSDSVSAAELAAVLHPTPAVAGSPYPLARQAIRTLESHDRGFYSGAVGWVDQQGDGAWYVSIRCGEIAGANIRLYAGAGIVPGSDPAREEQETAAKFLPLLHALGLDETIVAIGDDAA